MQHCTTLAILSLGATTALAAQQTDLRRVSLEGPRVGVVFIGGPRALAELRDHHLDPVMSLFGWHFEQQLTPGADGPALVTEEVLAVLGVEQSVAIPSATLLLGVRMASGLEMGVGPNVSPLGGALVVGAGWTLRYRGIGIPLNVAYVHSPGAGRLSLVIGYAMPRA
jgi:hypothetical protein